MTVSVYYDWLDQQNFCQDVFYITVAINVKSLPPKYVLLSDWIEKGLKLEQNLEMRHRILKHLLKSFFRTFRPRPTGQNFGTFTYYYDRIWHSYTIVDKFVHFIFVTNDYLAWCATNKFGLASFLQSVFNTLFTLYTEIQSYDYRIMNYIGFCTPCYRKEPHSDSRWTGLVWDSESARRVQVAAEGLGQSHHARTDRRTRDVLPAALVWRRARRVSTRLPCRSLPTNIHPSACSRCCCLHRPCSSRGTPACRWRHRFVGHMLEVA